MTDHVTKLVAEAFAYICGALIVNVRLCPNMRWEHCRLINIISVDFIIGVRNSRYPEHLRILTPLSKI